MKPWYRSRTLWLNITTIIALVVQVQAGFIIDADEQLALLAMINMVLRAITKEPLGA